MSIKEVLYDISVIKDSSYKIKNNRSLYNHAFMQLSFNELHRIQIKKIQKLYLFNVYIKYQEKSKPAQYKWYKNIYKKCSKCNCNNEHDDWINITKTDNICALCSLYSLAICFNYLKMFSGSNMNTRYSY